MTSLNGKDYSQRKPFKNITQYKVGQVRQGNLITAILRITDNQFGIYGYPASQTVKLDMCHEDQKRRENGQLKVNVVGRLLFIEKIC